MLSRLLDYHARIGKIEYHPRCKALGLTNLYFAYDLLIFSKGNISSVNGIFHVLYILERVSGLSINNSKSSAFLAGCDDLLSAYIRDTLGVAVGSLPIRYLGLPLSSKRLLPGDYEVLIEKIRKRFQSWTVQFLSSAGRLQLISTVIGSLTNFWCSVRRSFGKRFIGGYSSRV